MWYFCLLYWLLGFYWYDDVWVLFLQVNWSNVYQEGYMFMPFDAAHWCAISQVNLSILLCLRYHGHVTVWILLITWCKKALFLMGEINCALTSRRSNVWTPWFEVRLFDFVKMNTLNKCDIFVCLIDCWHFICVVMFEYWFCKLIDLMSIKEVTCSCPLMPLIDVQFTRSTSQLFCAWGTINILPFEYC